MHNKLKTILQHKQTEINAFYHYLEAHPDHLIASVMKGECELKSPISFAKNLKSSRLAVIAEIKRKSPSKGELAAITDPVTLASSYIEGGASALSILTDHEFFNGHIDDLVQVAKVKNNIPILRKDFILDKVQIAEAYVAGASAILCIVAALGDQLKSLLDYARLLHLDVVVEVHDRDELKIALDAGAEIIGVNNRNLKTLEVNTDCAFQLLPFLPASVVKIAESGIQHPDLARKYRAAGFDAVLIGEALVKSNHPQQFIRECCHD